MSRRPLRLLPQRIFGRFLHKIARSCSGATTIRPWLHRVRGVKIGRRVFIGEEVFIDNEYPDCVEIQDNAQVSIRVIIVAHTRGPGRVIIGSGAFIGPNSVLVCGAGRVLKIGDGAVIGAGSVITKSVPARLYVAPPVPQPLARVNVPLPLAESMEEFWSGLEPLDRLRAGRSSESASTCQE
jgi:acetyltransferase-like isoleucine patch superfamily enzyme